MYVLFRIADDDYGNVLDVEDEQPYINTSVFMYCICCKRDPPFSFDDHEDDIILRQ